jgi:hypothetical protein
MVNMLAQLTGMKLPEGGTIDSAPIATGGEFPKTLDAEMSELCINGLAIIFATNTQKITCQIEGPDATFAEVAHGIVSSAYIQQLAQPGREGSI